MGALFLVPFSLFWSGMALGGTARGIWRDGPDLPSVLFGLFALVCSISLWSEALMSVAGEVCFELRGDTLHYFSGLYPIGKTRTYDWTAIDSASEQIESISRRGAKRWVINLDGRERHTVGRALSAQQRYFVVQVLNDRLGQRATEGRTGSGYPFPTDSQTALR